MLIAEIVFCALTVGGAAKMPCLSESHPAGLALSSPCAMPGFGPPWRAGVQAGREFCWRPLPGRDAVRVAIEMEPLFDVAVTPAQARLAQLSLEGRIGLVARGD